MSESLSHTSFSIETGEIQEEEEVKVLTVGGLNALIKNNLESNFSQLWLKGELSNFKAHSSGHLYFSLKDKTSQISAVMFRGYTRQLKFKPKDGLEVLVRGRVSVYEPRGNYQVYVESMEPVGEGALQKAFEDLKMKLHREGLFDPAHKKELPYLPKKIALITSPTGAAVRDMIQILGRRYKAAEIILIPSMTQGKGAAESLLKSLDYMEDQDFDVAIIGRGGGSIEDLWCFNDEALARRIYACETPIVSAVGHEIDFTISDFVADMRAPTPSAAAELVSKNVEIIKENLIGFERKILLLLKQQINERRSKLNFYRRSLVDPKKRLADLRIKCDEWIERLANAQKNRIGRLRNNECNLKIRLLRNKNFVLFAKQRLSKTQDQLQPSFLNQYRNKKTKFVNLVGLMDSLSPLSVMGRGFSIIRKTDSKGQILTDSSQLRAKDQISIQMYEGHVLAEVKETEK